MAYRAEPHSVFLAEADNVGYTPSGAPWPHNDLYRDDGAGRLKGDQSDTILGEYRRFLAKPAAYKTRTSPNCLSVGFADLWAAHPSNRLDPKYHIFKRQERMHVPEGWITVPLGQVLKRREQEAHPEQNPERPVVVMTVSNKGEIRVRAAGKGKAPPEWLGMYFEDSPSTWYEARTNDVVYSSIDLWKGCLSVVNDGFDHALVTKEFPIYEVTDSRLDPAFLSCLLRTRYYQRAFRAITTGHSNRRRTQQTDFEDLSIAFPPDRRAQQRMTREILSARQSIQGAERNLRTAQSGLDYLIDGREPPQPPAEELDEDVADD